MTEDVFNSSDSVRNARPLRFVRTVSLSQGHTLTSSDYLPEVVVAYETWGTLNERKDNAILVCHALTGDSHLTSHDSEDDPGWWEILVGPGKYIDTNRYFVICANTLGGCRGTTGPTSIDPRTGQRYGTAFPTITIEDIVDVQKRLIEEELGIDRLLAIIGGSLGGHMALVWGTRYPGKATGAVALATGPHLTSQALAFDIVARNAIMNDPSFHQGKYYDNDVIPATGLAIARMLGHITYLSLESMKQKFGSSRNTGRNIPTNFETKFSVGSYLAHQGDKFVERFDANSYITLSMALDTFELGETREELIQTLSRSDYRWLVISFSSDWLHPPLLSKELVDSLVACDKSVSYCNIKSDCGHDAFLLANEIPIYGNLIQSFLNNLQRSEEGDGEESATITEAGLPPDVVTSNKWRIDYERILDLIPPNVKILDLGCGNGDLLSHLKRAGHKQLVGLEIQENYLLRCVEKGHNVIQADIDEGLHSFYDKQFDFVVLSKTLQSVRNVELVLEEMLRVGKRAIVSFPNLGFSRHRQYLDETGRAPQTDPRTGISWYNTNDVRFLTINDFHDFCHEKGYKIHREVALNTEGQMVIENDPNTNADVAIVVISNGDKSQNG